MDTNMLAGLLGCVLRVPRSGCVPGVDGAVDYETWWVGVFGANRSPSEVVGDFDLAWEGLREWIETSEAGASEAGANVNCPGAVIRALAEIVEALPSTCLAEWLADRGHHDLAAQVANYETVGDVDPEHWREADDEQGAYWVSMALTTIRP